MATTNTSTLVGVIGGAGLDELFEDCDEVDVSTPYGPTTAPVLVGKIGGRPVSFIPRHDAARSHAPHQIPFRANIWALAHLGVKALITASAVSGLRETFSPGTFVVTDQLVDLTSGRDNTFFDQGRLIRVTSSDPFDTTLRSIAVESLESLRVRFRDFGSTVVVQGPRFPTRAEARFYAGMGGDVVSMTLAPETTLALELGMGIVNVSIVTDLESPVAAVDTDYQTAELVERRLAQAEPLVRRVISSIAARVPQGFSPRSLVPADAIAEVLSRPAA